MRRFSAFALLLLFACSGNAENTDDNAQPLAGQCPHDFVLPNADGVLLDVGIVEVYWGNWWSTPEGKLARAAEDRAWKTLADDPRFYRALQAYAPPGKSIRGRFLASALVATALPDAPSVTKDVLEAELAKDIASGALPARAGDTVPIHVVHLPPGVTGPPLNAPDGPVDYAAYHHQMTLPSGTLVPYAVALFADASQLAIDQSHELYESITNPFTTGWRDRYKDAHGQHAEIGDVCAGNVATLDGYDVQALWSPTACGCVAPDSP